MTLMAGHYPGSAHRMHSAFGEIWGPLPRATLTMPGRPPLLRYLLDLPSAMSRGVVFLGL